MKKKGLYLAFLTLTCLSLFACMGKRDVRERPIELTANTNESKSMFYTFKAPALESGEEIDFSRYKGKKVIILNVASKCGYTSQYADWQAFYDKNKDKVEILGFPCNQFMGQEPGSSHDIAEFCSKNYGVTFQMFEKVDVQGKDKSPLYAWLSDKKQNGWNEKEPSWNFCKYLINEKGELTNFFSSSVKPDDAEFLTAIGK
jgi:glutathione peroxidase